MNIGKMQELPLEANLTKEEAEALLHAVEASEEVSRLEVEVATLPELAEVARYVWSRKPKYFSNHVHPGLDFLFQVWKIYKSFFLNVEYKIWIKNI